MAARINKEAITDLSASEIDDSILLAPDSHLLIGRWVKWEPSGESKKKYERYYIDCQERRRQPSRDGSLIQFNFSSWEDLRDNCLIGFAQWRQYEG